MIRVRGTQELFFASLLLMLPAAGILIHYAGLMSLRVGLLLFTPLALVAAVAENTADPSAKPVASAIVLLIGLSSCRGKGQLIARLIARQ